MHAQPSSGAICLIFGQTLRLLPYFMCANSKGSGETARMCRLTSVNSFFKRASSQARCQIFGWTFRLLPYFMCLNSEGSGETAGMCRLTSVNSSSRARCLIFGRTFRLLPYFMCAFAGHLCDKYHHLMSWLL